VILQTYFSPFKSQQPHTNAWDPRVTPFLLPLPQLILPPLLLHSPSPIHSDPSAPATPSPSSPVAPTLPSTAASADPRASSSTSPRCVVFPRWIGAGVDGDLPGGPTLLGVVLHLSRRVFLHRPRRSCQRFRSEQSKGGRPRWFIYLAGSVTTHPGKYRTIA
jgi:hypothetical protein